MKARLFALLLLAGIGLGSAQAMNLNSILIFKTADGKSLEMELVREMEYTDEVPRIIRELWTENASDPENHDFYQTLVRSLQKEEKEEPLPFKLD